MLVISLKKESTGEFHVLNRLRERVGPDREHWFFSLLAEINYYMPDGWRLTKSDNNFRIQVVCPKETFALIGHSFKKQAGDGIISIIDTVFKKGFFESEEAKKIQKTSFIDKHDKVKNPELIHPNLYFFQPCPDDSFSPLFARQYERVKYNEKKLMVGTQYHRIHPLTKSGLDLEHFKWIKWDINGNVEFVDFPEEDYHGKDFWSIPFLKTQGGRAEDGDYIQQYQNLLKEHNIEECKSGSLTPAPYEREIKFTYKGKYEDFHGLLPIVEKRIKMEGFSVLWESSKEQRDTYFDDDKFSLHASGTSFRLRKKKGNARITLKKRFPAASGEDHAKNGLYLRMEEEIAISKTQESALINGDRINAFPYRLIAYVAPECGKLKKVLEVVNKRTMGIIAPSDEGFQRIEFCHDVVEYLLDGKKFGPFFEIELESKGAELELVELLAEFLEKELNLEFSKGTKYEKGVAIIKDTRSFAK